MTAVTGSVRALAGRLAPFGPALVAGSALALAFPPLDAGLAGWGALVPLLVVLPGVPPRRGVALGAVCGAIFFGALLPWVLIVLFRFSGMPAVIGVLPWFLLVAYLSLYTAIFGGTVAALAGRRGEGTALLAAPVLWTGLEWLRGTLLTGFPWGVLGASQQGVLPALQLASLAGVYGVSFVLAAFSAAAAAALRFGWEDRRGRIGAAVAVALLSATAGWGWWRLRAPEPTEPALRIACLQGNSPPELSDEEAVRALGLYERLTTEAANRRAGLILWAESSTPYGFEMDRSFRRFVEELSKTTGASIVLGSIGGPSDGPYFNGAFLVRPAAGAHTAYRKIHLVPYGEYVPLGSLMPFISRFVTSIGEFEPGERPVVWDLDGIPVTPLICYEAIFPSLVRAAVADGGGVLINLTYDGWFGHSGGPAQHLGLTRLRSVETARPLVRAAETGISAVYDSRGRELARGGLLTQEIVMATVSPGREWTPYARIGDALPAGCAIITIVLAAPFLLRRRPELMPPPPPPGTSEA